MAVDDRALVSALVAGDPRGLEGAYRRYADRLYTYCRGLLPDPDSAADAVHDTFVIASERAGQLRDPERLRSWLYAIARNECFRLLRHRARQMPVAELEQRDAPPADPAAGVSAAELQELVWAAVAGLNPGDREIVELEVRHELATDEVGAVLGISQAHAHARRSRAREQLGRAVGALLVARTGAGDCPSLAALLQGWDGRLTALIRKRVARHIDSCDTCGDRQREQVRPAALFAAYAAAPLLAAPAELWPRLEHTSFDPGLGETRAEVARRAGRFDHDGGFPRPSGARRHRMAVAAAAAAVLLAVAGAGAAVIAGAGEPGTSAQPTPAGAPAASPTPPAGTPLAPAAPVTSPATGLATAPAWTTDPLPPVAGQQPPQPTPVDTGAPAPPPTAGPVQVSAEAVARCARETITLAVRAEASEPLAEAVAWVQSGSSEPASHDMQVSGSTAEVLIGPLPAEPLWWWVTVQGDRGGSGATEPASVPDSCD